MATGYSVALSPARPIGRALPLVTCLVILVPWAARAQVYRATDIGTLGGAHTYGQAVNNSEQVVGTSEDARGTVRAFLFADGVLHDLGTLGGSSARALGINSAGQVVGASDTTGDAATHATLWDHGTISDLGNLANDPALNSHAEAISDAGVIFGGADVLCLPAAGGLPCGTLGRLEHAFVYANGSMKDIDGGTQGAGSYAAAIDSTGRIGGFIENTTPYVPDQVVLWASSASGLVPLFSAASIAPRVALSANGSIAATAYRNVSYAALWINGAISDLSASYARLYCKQLPCPSGVGGIDAMGNVVGWIAVPTGPKAALMSQPTVATVWRGNAMTSLGRLLDPVGPVAPYLLSYATATNEGGAVVVVGIDAATGSEHSFLLSPEVVNLKADPAKPDFGKVLETSSRTIDVVLQNAAANPIRFLTEVTGPFKITDHCTAGLAPAASCTVSVVFSPMLPGLLTGTLTLATLGGSTNGTAIMTVPLSGTGDFVAHLSYREHFALFAWQAPYTISWSSAPGVGCKASGGTSGDSWSGNLPSSGSINIFPSETGNIVYGVTCRGGGLVSAANITIYIYDSDVSGGIGALTIPQLLALLAAALHSCWIRASVQARD